MLLPKRVKYRRVHRGRMTGKATRGNFVSNGEFGIQATEPCWITSNQIEAARIAMTRYTKQAFPRKLRVRHCVWQATSCPARPSSLPVRRMAVKHDEGI